MADKKISQLDSASSVSSGAYFPISQSGTTYKGTTDQIGEQIATNQDFSELNTTSKKVIGAINEVLANSDKDIISSIDTPAPIMTFNNGGDNIPVNKLLVAVTAQQAGSGTPSPSNPRAISGWSSANISVSDGVTPTTITIPFGDTYYGGVLDVTNGKLTVTHSIVDMGDLTYTSAGTLRAVGKNTIQSVTGLNPKRTSTADCICSVDELTQTTNQIRFATITTPEADMPTTYAGQKIVFELETYTEINLTPTQIITLSGLNNIYADCGDIQLLEYFNENADDLAKLIRAMT